MPDAALPSLADRLLEAQVAYHVDRLTGKELGATVARLAEAVLDNVASTNSLRSSTPMR